MKMEQTLISMSQCRGYWRAGGFNLFKNGGHTDCNCKLGIKSKRRESLLQCLHHLLSHDQLNALSGPISVGYDPYGVWGFAGIDEQIQDVTFLGVPLILIDSLDGNQGVVSSSTWLPLVSEVTPTPPPVNDYNIDSDDTE